MNWSRGMLRAWVALTVLWLGYSAYAIVDDWRAEQAWAKVGTPVPEPEKGLYFNLPMHEKRAIFAVIVPVGVFAAGWTLLWVGRGFKRTNP